MPSVPTGPVSGFGFAPLTANGFSSLRAGRWLGIYQFERFDGYSRREDFERKLPGEVFKKAATFPSHDAHVIRQLCLRQEVLELGGQVAVDEIDIRHLIYTD